MARNASSSPFLGAEAQYWVNGSSHDGNSDGEEGPRLPLNLIDALAITSGSPSPVASQYKQQQLAFGTSVRSPLPSPAASSSFLSSFHQTHTPSLSHSAHPRASTLSNFSAATSLAQDYSIPAQQRQQTLPRAVRSSSGDNSNNSASRAPDLLSPFNPEVPLSPEPYAASQASAATLSLPFDGPEGFGPPKRSATAAASLWASGATRLSSPSSGQGSVHARDIWRNDGKETASLFSDLRTPPRQNSGNSDSSLWLTNDSDSPSSSSFHHMESLRPRGPPMRAATLAVQQSLGLHPTASQSFVSEPDSVLRDDVIPPPTSSMLDADSPLEVRSASPSTLEFDRAGQGFGSRGSSTMDRKPLGSRRAMLLQGVRAPQRAATLDPSNHLPRPQTDAATSPLRLRLSPVQDGSEAASTSRSSTLIDASENAMHLQAYDPQRQRSQDDYLQPQQSLERHQEQPEARERDAHIPPSRLQHDAAYGVDKSNIDGSKRGKSTANDHDSQPATQSQFHLGQAQKLPPGNVLPQIPANFEAVHSDQTRGQLHSNAQYVSSRSESGKVHSAPANFPPRMVSHSYNSVNPIPQQTANWRASRTPQQQPIVPSDFTQHRRPNLADPQLYHALSAMSLNSNGVYGSAGVTIPNGQYLQPHQQVGLPATPYQSYAAYATSTVPPHIRTAQPLSHVRPVQHQSNIVTAAPQVTPSTTSNSTSSSNGFSGTRSTLLEEFRHRRAAAGPPVSVPPLHGSGYPQRFNSNGVFGASSNDPTANWVLDDIRGHVVEFCMDQHGSRFAQDRLDHASRDQVNWVFDEIRPSARSLMQDVFGNYVVQKMFEYGSNEQRLSLTEEFRSHVVSLSLSTYGCRVIQKALDYLPDHVRLELAEEFKGQVLEMVQDQNANHVIQKLLSVVENPDDIRFISDTFHGRVITLGSHCYSCRVLQRIFERCGQNQARPLLEELHQSSERLMADQYGNYVIQWILQRGLPQDKMRVIETVMGKVLPLSRHKFASNVVEQVVRAADKSQLRRLASEILEPVGGTSSAYSHEEDHSMMTKAENRPATIMMTDQYANYVLQRFIELCEPDQKMRLVEILQPSLIALRRGAGGPGGWTKHLAAVERLVGEAIVSCTGGVGSEVGVGNPYIVYHEASRPGNASPTRVYGGGGGARYAHPIHDLGVA